jgi:YVTN family beta-propeller protein
MATSNRTIRSRSSIVASLKEVKKVDLGALARPHGIAENGGERVYFTSEATRTIARYDPAADKVDWVAGTGQTATHMLVVAKDGKRFWTANIGSDTATEIQVGPPVGGIWQFKVGKQPEAIDISPDEREVWVGQNGDGHISIIGHRKARGEGKLQVGELPIRLKFTPDGKRVVVTDPKGSAVIVIDAATRKEVKRIPMDGVPLGIQMAPDGKRALHRARASRDRGGARSREAGGRGKRRGGQGTDGLAYASPR